MFWRGSTVRLSNWAGRAPHERHTLLGRSEKKILSQSYFLFLFTDSVELYETDTVGLTDARVRWSAVGCPC